MGRSRVDASAIITPEPCGMHNVTRNAFHNDFRPHLLIHSHMCSSCIRIM